MSQSACTFRNGSSWAVYRSLVLSQSHGILDQQELEAFNSRDVMQNFCGRGYFVFLFEKKEDRDLIFRSRPYFMGSRGMYLNRWSMAFDPVTTLFCMSVHWCKRLFWESKVIYSHTSEHEVWWLIWAYFEQFWEKTSPPLTSWQQLQTCQRIL